MNIKKWRIAPSKHKSNLKSPSRTKRSSQRSTFNQFYKNFQKENQLLFTILVHHLVSLRSSSNSGVRTALCQSIWDRQLTSLPENTHVWWWGPSISTMIKSNYLNQCCILKRYRWKARLIVILYNCHKKSKFGSVHTFWTSRSVFWTCLVMNLEIFPVL